MDMSQMHSMSYLLSRCEGLSKRGLFHDDTAWIQHGNEQEQQDRAAGVQALFSLLATTTSRRAKELVKQGLSSSGLPVTIWKTSGWCGNSE